VTSTESAIWGTPKMTINELAATTALARSMCRKPPCAIRRPATVCEFRLKFTANLP
jgi:hypothetical protein